MSVNLNVYFIVQLNHRLKTGTGLATDRVFTLSHVHIGANHPRCGISHLVPSFSCARELEKERKVDEEESRSHRLGIESLLSYQGSYG